jgi:hypothetical protein
MDSWVTIIKPISSTLSEPEVKDREVPECLLS